mgnify:CR=1 FL=1
MKAWKTKYDNEEEDRFAVLAQRRMAIEELAATWDTSFDTEEKEEHEEGQSCRDWYFLCIGKGTTVSRNFVHIFSQADVLS